MLPGCHAKPRKTHATTDDGFLGRPALRLRDRAGNVGRTFLSSATCERRAERRTVLIAMVVVPV